MLRKTLLLIAAGSVLGIGLANANPVSGALYVNPINGVGGATQQDFGKLTAKLGSNSVAMYNSNANTPYTIGNNNLVIYNGSKEVARFSNAQLKSILGLANVNNVNLAYTNPSHRVCLASTQYHEQITVNGQALDLCLGTHS